jgi:phosphatidylethanolamine-binding protein (PEBP) family uncharacterized protein
MSSRADDAAEGEFRSLPDAEAKRGVFADTRSLVLAGPALLTLTAAIALGGCGSSGPAKLHSGLVAKVGDSSIGAGELSHWISLEATFAQKKSGVKVTKPLIIDPPTYSACIAGLKSAPAAPAPGKTQTNAPGQGASSSALKSQCQTQYEQLKPSVLEHLIFVDWVLGEASHLGLKASAGEIQQKLNETKQGFEKQGGYQKFLQQSGMTATDLLREVTFSELEGKLSQKISNEVMAKASAQGVSHAQISSYYKQNLSKYEHPESRTIQLLLSETPAEAQKAKSEISSGKSFASVDKRVSKDSDPVTKQRGGEIGGLVAKEMEAEKSAMPGVFSTADRKTLVSAIFSAKAGVLEGPLSTHDASYVLLVKQIKKGEPTETLAQVESAIKQTLTRNRGQQMFSNFNDELQKRWKARTNCAKAFVIPYCEQYNPPKPPSAKQQRSEYQRQQKGTAAASSQSVQITLSSTAVSKPSLLAATNGAVPKILKRYTCDGANISPALSWGTLPKGTAEVLVEVLQAGGRSLSTPIWMLAGISPQTHSISAGSIPPAAVVGRNSAGKAAWGGICPAHGAEYQYTVVLAALSKKLGLKSGFSPSSAQKALQGDRLGNGLLSANYKRP